MNMNELTNFDALAQLAREHQEEMLCEAERAALLRGMKQEHTLLKPTLVLVLAGVVLLALLLSWGVFVS